jgi:Rab3 GTPase-activating protein catalytic subunit
MADEFEEDPCSRFVDYTNATSWEQFVADVELQLKRWGLSDSGLYNSVSATRFSSNGDVVVNERGRLISEITYEGRPYSLALYNGSEAGMLPSAPLWKEGEEHFTPTMIALADPANDFSDDGEYAHPLQLWFGCRQFLVLSPRLQQETSIFGGGVGMNEATLLLSTVSVALANCNSTMPAFVTTNDSGSAAYLGYSPPNADGAASIRFDTEYKHHLPDTHQTVESLTALLKSKLQVSGSLHSSSQPVDTSVCYKWSCDIMARGIDKQRTTWWRQMAPVEMHVHACTPWRSWSSVE